MTGVRRDADLVAPPPVHRSVLGGAELADLQSWTTAVEAWPVGSHVWGHYAEQTDSGTAICRTENVSACHAGFAHLVTGALAAIAGTHLGAAAVDFKDKINYKHPGGAGFSPHQDLVAYPGVHQVVSVLVAVDECTTTSGCLWMDPGVREILPTDDRGVIAERVVSSLAWTPIELEPGDAVCIGGVVPHFSEANRSASKRRVLVASYAPREAGYSRAAYYDARGRAIDGANATNRVRISTLADFEGRAPESAPPASTPSSASGTCSHG